MTLQLTVDLYWYTPHYLNAYDSAYYQRFGLEDEIKLTDYNRIKQDFSVHCHPSDVYPAWRSTPCAAIRVGRYKLIYYFDNKSAELYNLSEDIGETVNLIDELPEKSEELLEMLINWMKNSGAPYPLPVNPKYRPNIYVDYR